MHILVEVEGGDDDNRNWVRDAWPGQEAGCFDTVEDGHSDVHQTHVGAEFAGQSHRLLPVPRLADDLDAVEGAETQAHAGSHEIAKGNVVIGETTCLETPVLFPAGDTLSDVSCEVTAGDAAGATDGAVVMDNDQRVESSGELDIVIAPAPCPSISLDGRTDAAFTIPEMVDRWNAAVAATRGDEESGSADPCEDLTAAWEMPVAAEALDANSARIGTNSNLLWRIDQRGRVTEVSVSLAVRSESGDQLRRDVVRNVLAATVAANRAEAVGLAAEWDASCRAGDRFEAFEEGAGTLTVRFCR